MDLAKNNCDVDSPAAIDPSAAFPTAIWVAALRAIDARSPAPRIGSNVGAGADTLAAHFAGQQGDALMHAHPYLAHAASAIVDRTLLLDAAWAAARARGVAQFVELAAGLDARAWRLPTQGGVVFELDVPCAIAYKDERLAELGGRAPPLTCRRVVVAADLSSDHWPGLLRGAGFRADLPSFWLVEGLLMYLPSEAPEQLLRAIAALMSPGSSVAGDAAVGVLTAQPPFLREIGTRWSNEFASREAVVALVKGAGLGTPKLDEIALTPPPSDAGADVRAAWPWGANAAGSASSSPSSGPAAPVMAPAYYIWTATKA